MIVIAVCDYGVRALAGWKFSGSNIRLWLTKYCSLEFLIDATAIEVEREMKVGQLYITRQFVGVICGLMSTASLAIGAHATLDVRTSEESRVVFADESVGTTQLALIIGNGHYPDAAQPLNQPISDASSLADAMSRRGFSVDVVEDATKGDMALAVERLKSRIKPGSVVMLFFGGYGVQSGRENYMIPIDATIWTESDVRHEGMSIEAVLDAMNERGARAKLVVLDASRRNPYERRFRSYSHGLAPINAPVDALVLSSNTSGNVSDDTTSEHSVLVTELLSELDRQGSAEGVFNKTRLAVSRVSNGEQMPSVSSSLLEDVSFSPSEDSITSALPPSKRP